MVSLLGFVVVPLGFFTVLSESFLSPPLAELPVVPLDEVLSLPDVFPVLLDVFLSEPLVVVPAELPVVALFSAAVFVPLGELSATAGLAELSLGSVVGSVVVSVMGVLLSGSFAGFSFLAQPDRSKRAATADAKSSTFFMSFFLLYIVFTAAAPGAREAPGSRAKNKNAVQELIPHSVRNNVLMRHKHKIVCAQNHPLQERLVCRIIFHAVRPDGRCVGGVDTCAGLRMLAHSQAAAFLFFKESIAQPSPLYKPFSAKIAEIPPRAGSERKTEEKTGPAGPYGRGTGGATRRAVAMANAVSPCVSFRGAKRRGDP